MAEALPPKLKISPAPAKLEKDNTVKEERTFAINFMQLHPPVPLAPFKRTVVPGEFSTPTSLKKEISWSERLPKSPQRLLLFAFAGLSMLCGANRFLEKRNSDTASEVPTEITSVDFHTAADHIELGLNNHHKYTLNIYDYNSPELWDSPLAGPEAASYLADNVPYQYYEQIITDQYQRSFSGTKDFTLPPVETAMSLSGNIPLVQKNSFEPRNMTPGEYPSYRDIYGSMEWGDYATLKSSWLNLWRETAAQNGWDESLENLTAYQWMILIQTPGSQLEYANELFGGGPEYSAKLEAAFRNYTISDLWETRRGVCRDVERINIAAFQMANDLFYLEARGLLYVSLTNFADLRHARGLFFIGEDELTVTAIGVDTTSSHQDIFVSWLKDNSTDTLAWYSQQFNKNFFTDPSVAESFYDYAFNSYGTDLHPTALVLLERERIEAKIKVASTLEEEKDYQRKILETYQLLDLQLRKEKFEVNPIFYVPSRVVPLYDELAAMGKELDRLEIKNGVAPVYEVMAREVFSSYLTTYGVDPARARAAVDTLSNIADQDDHLINLYFIINTLDDFRASQE